MGEQVLADRALDEALLRIGELSGRLWAVRLAHRPVRRRLGRDRCAGCGAPSPCPTARLAAG